jgi:hypothetical protein
LSTRLHLEIDPHLTEPYLVYALDQLNARVNSGHFRTPEALLSCLTNQLGIDSETAQHAVNDLSRRGKAQIVR